MPQQESIDLNSADLEELAEIEGVGRQRAQDLIENRPYDSWDDVLELPGFSEQLVRKMQQAGVTIGGTKTRRAG